MEAVVVNNGELDQDFIVRSNNQSHMLTVNGGTDRVGIKDSNTFRISELSVAGMISITEEQGSTPHQQTVMVSCIRSLTVSYSRSSDNAT